MPRYLTLLAVAMMASFVGAAALLANPSPSVVKDAQDMRKDLPRVARERLPEISYSAHHGLFDEAGNRIDPSMEQLHDWVERQYGRVLERASPEMRDRALGMEKELGEALRGEELVLRSLMLEWIATEDKQPGYVGLQSVNRAVREHWFKKVLDRDEFIKIFDSRTSLPKDLAALMRRMQILPDEAGDDTGEPYMRTCRDAGVPVPPTWSRSSGDWKKEGDLIRNFLSLGEFTEVWTYEEERADGICVALPRWDEDPDEVSNASGSAVGIICLGRKSSNACFYDTGTILANQEREIINFESGGSLFNGVCSDCHAGENPYIVHSGGPLDMGARIRPQSWHNPIIRSDWPQNPGPLTLLDAVPLLPFEQSCLSCHTSSFAGRFPDVLALTEHKRMRDNNPNAIARYCTSVLNRAISGYVENFGSGGTNVAPTMARIPDPIDPGNIRKGTPDPDFETHRQAMIAFCSQVPADPPGNVPVDPKDDPSVLSPPVLGPLYACSERIEVRGAVYDAQVVVSINGADEPSVQAKSSDGFSIKVNALAAGDQVQVSQTVDGQTATSDIYEVISHQEHYPDGLPRPEIDPNVVHQCGRVIAVRHIPGAFVTILSNGGDPVKYTSGGDWTNMRPGKSPFDENDEFVAEQGICTDTSNPSGKVTAGPEPQPLPVPMLKDGVAIAGQPYLHIENMPEGARTEVSGPGGLLLTFSTAVTWNPEVDVATGLGRLVEPGDSFTIVSQLCEEVKVETDRARPCEALPAPMIAQPFAGDTSVTVTSFVPGARILVFDAGSNEIGDASGTEVGLVRALVAGDVLTVVQRLEDCVSREGYRIAAVCASEEKCG